MKKLFRILFILVIIGFVIYAGLFIMVLWKEKHVQPAESYDAIIVLGAQVKPDGTPNVQLQWRLDAAYEAWRKQPCTIVVCGAQGADEPRPEGDVMRDYLLALGVPDEQILVDSSSFNTRENLHNAAVLMGREEVRVVVVTSDYHLPRALAMAEDAGFKASGIASPTLGGFYWLKNHLREPLAWVKYWMEKALNWNFRWTWTRGRGGAGN